MMLRSPFKIVLLGLLLGSSVTRAELRETFDALEVRTGAIYLQRTNAGNDPILSGIATTLLSTGDIQSGEDTGWELSLFGNLSDQQRLEFRYFGFDGIHYGGTFTDPGAVLFNTHPFGSGQFDFPVMADIELQTELTNYELNYREQIRDQVEFLCGVRHIRNLDTMSGFFTRISDPTQTNFVEFGAKNYLTGFQIGLDAVLLDLGRFSLEGLLKTGIYHNQVSTSFIDLSNGVDVGNRKDVPAFVGEVQLTAVYEVSSSSNLRIGYQLFVMTNIASAPNQVDGSVAFPVAAHTTSALATESPVYQGLFAQLEFFLYE